MFSIHPSFRPSHSSLLHQFRRTVDRGLSVGHNTSLKKRQRHSNQKLSGEAHSTETCVKLSTCRERMIGFEGIDICVGTTADTIKNFMASAPTSRSQITCFRCGEQGHYKSECFHWKTRPCSHFLTVGCKDPNCSFAHGTDFRTPWLTRCIRVIKKDRQLIIMGCREYGHTYKHCPKNTDSSI